MATPCQMLDERSKYDVVKIVLCWKSVQPWPHICKIQTEGRKVLKEALDKALEGCVDLK
jgi:hypothetical protein